jgi:hypothetical protein
MTLFFPTQQASKVLSKGRFEEEFLTKLSTKCVDKDNSSCIMAKFLNYMNKVIKKPSFTINKRLTLLQTRSVCVRLRFTDHLTSIAAALSRYGSGAGLIGSDREPLSESPVNFLDLSLSLSLSRSLAYFLHLRLENLFGFSHLGARCSHF